MKYKVITILNPDLKATTLNWVNQFDNNDYPDIEIDVRENDFEMFIIDEYGICYRADDFFSNIDIKEFEVK